MVGNIKLVSVWAYGSAKQIQRPAGMASYVVEKGE